jgi:preprotein translocase SecE subunit
MAMSIHKPGQGYWVRVMTAGLIGLVTVALALWLYGQGRLIAESLPKRVWSAAVLSKPGDATALTPGTPVRLFAAAGRDGKPAAIGSAVFAGLETGTTGAETVRLTDVKIDRVAGGPRRDASEMATIVPQSATDITPSNSFAVNRPVGTAPIDGMLLGGSIVAGVLVIGTVIGFWLVGVRVKTVEWLIACDYEMSRVNWSTPKVIMGSTWVVIGACLLLSAILFLSDFGFRFLGQLADLV